MIQWVKPKWVKPKWKDYLLILPVSPTRFFIERLHPKPIRAWNWIFRGILAAWIIELWFTNRRDVWQWPFWLGWIVLWLLPFSRVNELALGFYLDAIQRFKGPASRTKTDLVERLELLFAAYFEVACQFGILYFCALPSGYFAKDFGSIIQALYFSVVTITTVGYGDITPQKSVSQIMCIHELVVGFTIIAFALGSYFATSLANRDERSPTDSQQKSQDE